MVMYVNKIILKRIDVCHVVIHQKHNLNANTELKFSLCILK